MSFCSTKRFVLGGGSIPFAPLNSFSQPGFLVGGRFLGKNKCLHVPDVGLLFKKQQIDRSDTAFQVKISELIVPDTGLQIKMSELIVPDTGLQVKMNELIVPDTGFQVRELT